MTPRLLVALAVLGSASCLESWEVAGPYRCSADGTCPAGLGCDDGLCCDPDGTPPCPTLPGSTGLCPGGGRSAAFYEDRDGDGFGNPNVRRLLCTRPLAGGWVADERDCDDADPAISPASVELCNGRDDNCDGVLDDGLSPRTTFYRDEDGDAFGADAVTSQACAAPPGHVLVGGDCAPSDPTRHPGAAELCNGVSDDCDAQVDEAPLADVQNAGDAVLRYPCFTSRPGLCRAGEFRCVGGRRECASRRAPETEVCDELDNNCDGRVDEQPACGGPPSFVNAPDATWGAFRLTSTGALNVRCQKGVAGNVAEGADRTGAWSGGNSPSGGFHGWYIEAPATAPWDLSAPDVKLTLRFTATAAGTTNPDGLWGDPATGDAFNPVVYLCGADDFEVVRYRLTAASSAFSHDAGAFSGVLQLNLQNPGNAWIIGIGSGFNTSKVRRVELVIQAFTSAYTITFAPDTGFSR